MSGSQDDFARSIADIGALKNLSIKLEKTSQFMVIKYLCKKAKKEMTQYADDNKCTSEADTRSL
jgi:hypothetical protein